MLKVESHTAQSGMRFRILADFSLSYLSKSSKSRHGAYTLVTARRRQYQSGD